MPIQLQKISPEDLAAVFARRPRGSENVEDYIEMLNASKMQIGSGLSLKTQIVTPDEGDSYTILAESADEDDPAGVTVRAAKRRFNMAAKELGFGLDWREVNGYLVMRATELKPEEAEDGKVQS